MGGDQRLADKVTTGYRGAAVRRETEGSRKYLEKQENIISTMEGDTNTANVETVSYKKIVSIFAHLQIGGEEF